VTRNDFKRLARLRLKEVKALLDAGYYSGAYYLCGYVVEYGLKACITKRAKQYEFPPDPDTVRRCYSHNYDNLVKAAELGQELKEQVDGDHDFRKNWTAVSQWSEQTRYLVISEPEARALFKSVSDPDHGVLRWLKSLW
jgi:HEPN domain-containing protein